MAYIAKDLALFSHGNGFQHWRYDTLDAAATVDTAGYFTGEAVGMLKVGDIITRVTWNTTVRTGTVSAVGQHVVLSNDGTTVDVSDATVIAVTDTD